MRGQAELLWFYTGSWDPATALWHAVQNNTSRGVNEEAGQQESRW